MAPISDSVGYALIINESDSLEEQMLGVGLEELSDENVLVV